MSRSNQSKTAMIITGTVAAALLVVGAFYLISKHSGGDSAANAAASVLPANVAGLAWSTSVDDALALVAAMQINGVALDRMGLEYSRLVAQLGFDPLTRTALQDLGLDTSRAPAIALAPAPRAKGLVVIYLPILSDQSGISSFVKITGKFGSKAPLVERTEENGHAVGWVYKMEGEYAQMNIPSESKYGSGDGEAAPSYEAQRSSPPRKSLRGVLIDVDAGLLLVVPVDHSRHLQDEIEGELRGFVSKAVDDTIARLSTLDGFEECVAGSDGALLGVYANPAGLREMMAGERDLAPFLAALTEVAGFGAYVKEEENSLVAVVQTVASGESPKMILRERDRQVLKLLPGKPLAGVHLAVDTEVMMRELEKGLALEPRTWRDYQEGKGEIQEALRLPGVEIHQLWDGELGIFLGDMAPNPEFIARSIIGFAGIKDAAKLKTALDAVAMLAGGKVVAEKIGDADGWRVSEDGLTMGIMLHDNRLWFAGDWSALAKIQQGETGELLDGERNEKIAAVLDESNGFASFTDLKKPMALAQSLMGRGDREIMAAVGPLLAKLDYFTYTGSQEGRVSIAKATLHLDGQDFTAAVAEAVGGQFLAAADKYGRKAKTAEAIDMLDKIYKGAADYYSTPRVEQNTASKLDCQFPDDVPSSPAQTCCANYGGPDADGDDRCDAAPYAWSDRTWSALKFQITDQHYCVYSFATNGRTGSDAQFTANAHCDLDCDGIMSTFQRYGRGDRSNTYGECSIISAAALFSSNETE